MDAIIASITTIHLPRSRLAVLQKTCARFFRGRKFLKLFKSLMVGQAVPEIPLSVGSKLELLLRAFVFAKCRYTSPYTHAFVRVCILPCILYIRILKYYIIHCIYMTEAPRVLHFSAFINPVVCQSWVYILTRKKHEFR